MATKNRITVNLDPQEYTDLVELSQKLDVSLAWLGRRALSELLERYCDDKNDGASKGSVSVDGIRINER